MSQELTETIMTTHIHFTLLLVFPPVFGMRWMTMVLVCGLVLVLFLPIWLNFASSLIFFPPVRNSDRNFREIWPYFGQILRYFGHI